MRWPNITLLGRANVCDTLLERDGDPSASEYAMPSLDRFLQYIRLEPFSSANSHPTYSRHPQPSKNPYPSPVTNAAGAACHFATTVVKVAEVAAAAASLLGDPVAVAAAVELADTAVRALVIPRNVGWAARC